MVQSFHSNIYEDYQGDRGYEVHRKLIEYYISLAREEKDGHAAQAGHCMGSSLFVITLLLFLTQVALIDSYIEMEEHLFKIEALFNYF